MNGLREAPSGAAPAGAAPAPSGHVVVIGVGNEFRSDDGVGLVIARRIRERVPATVAVVEASGEGAALLDAWQGATLAILCDAAHSGADPGTVLRMDALAMPIPFGCFRYSTHAFSVAEAIELGRVLGTLPARLLVYGIEGTGFAPGIGLSAPVTRAADAVIAAVLADLDAATPRPEESDDA